MRKPGTYPETTNIEGKIAWTYDARNMVQSFADLLLLDSTNYIPNGFPVSVYDADAAKVGLYICINKNALNNAASWKKVGEFDVSDYYTKADVDSLLAAKVSYPPILIEAGSPTYTIAWDADMKAMFGEFGHFYFEQYIGAGVWSNQTVPYKIFTDGDDKPSSYEFTLDSIKTRIFIKP